MKHLGWDTYLVQLVLVVVVVLSTCNAEVLSYCQRVSQNIAHFDMYNAFTGVMLVTGWVILIHVTPGSPGATGLTLATAFISLLIWLVFDAFSYSDDSMIAAGYILEFTIACALSIGIARSHVRRRISGRADTCELERTVCCAAVNTCATRPNDCHSLMQ